MWWAALSWYGQDLLQVLGAGAFLAPELFLVGLLAQHARNEVDMVTTVWAGFFGGLLWDLRWTGLPGLSAVMFALLLGFSCALWRLIPEQGKHPGLFILLTMICHLGAGVVRGYLLGTSALSPNEVWTVVSVQQLAALPLVALAGLWVQKKKGEALRVV